MFTRVELTGHSWQSLLIWFYSLHFFGWWFSSKTEVKNNDYYVQIFLFYLLIFSHWFLKSNKISSMKLLFPRSDTRPTQVWLWIHMTHFEQSDWLRSPNLTNIMIEYLTSYSRLWLCFIQVITGHRCSLLLGRQKQQKIWGFGHKICLRPKIWCPIKMRYSFTWFSPFISQW